MFHKPDSRFHQPAFSLLACATTKTAALVVRGTGSIQDVITDIQAMPVPFPSPRGDAESGKGDVEDVFFLFLVGRVQWKPAPDGVVAGFSALVSARVETLAM